jgi:hypothetical protein
VGLISLASVDSNGYGNFARVSAGQNSDLAYSAALSVNTTGTAVKGVVVRAVASQSSALTEWQDSSGSVIADVTATGRIRSNLGFRFTANNATIEDQNGASPYIQFNSSQITHFARSSTFIPIAVRGAASQSANLQEWQNSGGTVIARVDSAGVFLTNQYFDVNQSFGGIAQQGTYRIRFGNSSVGIGATSPPSSGATGIVMFVSNLTSAPSSNPTGGGFLYVESGALKYRGSSGTITTLGAA